MHFSRRIAKCKPNCINNLKICTHKDVLKLFSITHTNSKHDQNILKTLDKCVYALKLYFMNTKNSLCCFYPYFFLIFPNCVCMRGRYTSIMYVLNNHTLRVNRIYFCIIDKSLLTQDVRTEQVYCVTYEYSYNWLNR